MIIHLSCFLGTPDENTKRRMTVARESWERRYRCGRYIAPLIQPTRNSVSVGEAPGSEVPFVKDLIAEGMKLVAGKEDIILLTNADVGFVKHFTERLEGSLRFGGSARYLTRTEVPRIDYPLDAEALEAFPEYVGADAFAFLPEWWEKFGPSFPDFLMGRYGWDSCLKNMMRATQDDANLPPLRRLIWHETHPSFWNSTPDIIQTLPGNVHNRKLLEGWIAEHGGHCEDHLYTGDELHYK